MAFSLRRCACFISADSVLLSSPFSTARAASRSLISRSFLPCSPPPYHSRPSPGSLRLCRRGFSSSGTLSKKKNKHHDDDAAHSARPSKTVHGGQEDDFDLAALKAAVDGAVKRLSDDLAKMPTGGRFNPEVLSNLRVQLKKGDKGSVVKLGDLAQVVPQGGRTVVIMAGEKEHVKAIQSAVQVSSLSLTPQVDAANEQNLVMAVPAPTAESRRATVAQAVQTSEAAKAAVRQARQAHQKRLRRAELGRAVRPDDLRRATKDMDAEVARGLDRLKAVLAGFEKAISA